MLTQHRKNSASYSSEKVNDLRRTKANLEKKIANGNDTLLRAGYIPSIADALKESNEKLATVNRQLDELRTISIKQVTSKEVEALRTNFYDTIKNHKPELVKALNQCVDSIIVGTDDVTIIYRYN